MRTIGKKWTKQVKALTKDAIRRNVDDVQADVFKRLPSTLFNTWEGAYQEIVSIIEDTLLTHELGEDRVICDAKGFHQYTKER